MRRDPIRGGDVVRIVMVNKFARVTGGADRYCLTLARLLREDGHAVAFLSTESSENAEAEGRFVPALVDNTVRDGLSAEDRIHVAATAVWNRDAARAARRLIDEWRPDVVHAHKLYPQLSVAPIVTAVERGIPVVQTMHDYEFSSAGETTPGGGSLDRDESRLSYRALNTGLYQIKRHVHVPRVRRWIAISRYVAAVHRVAGIESQVIPHFAEAHGSVRGYRDRAGVVFVGRLTANKGVTDIPALSEMLPDVHVSVAGDGPLRGWLTEAARGNPRISVLGHVDPDRLARLVGESLVSVIPSRWPEPAGLVALEAMAAGTPVVAYSGGGIGEYVERAGGGVLVENDARAMAGAVAAITADPGRWEALSRTAMDGIRAGFSPDRHLALLDSVYRDAIEACDRQKAGAR